MKTPKEILLERRRSIEPKLDSIRESVLSTECRHEKPIAEPETALPLRAVLKLWRELIWPARRVWAGFALVWLIIVTLNLTDSAPPQQRSVATSKPASGGMPAIWQEQRKVLAELTGSMEPVDMDKPKVTAPKPRSQWRQMFPIA